MKLPQFSFRDLFWLVLVSALAIAWWSQCKEQTRRAEQALRDVQRSAAEIAATRRESARLQESLSRLKEVEARRLSPELVAIARLRESGAEVTETANGHAVKVSFQDKKHVEADSLIYVPALPYLERIELYRSDAPDDALKHVGKCKTLTQLTLSLENTDDGLKHLLMLENLQSLHLGETRITDNGAVHIAHFKKLNRLWLYQRTFTGTGLTELCGLKELNDLYLGSPNLTDDSLAALACLPQLRQLGIGNSGVTDAGLVHLRHLNTLDCVFVHNTEVSRDAIAELQRTLPQCRIAK